MEQNPDRLRQNYRPTNSYRQRYQGNVGDQHPLRTDRPRPHQAHVPPSNMPDSGWQNRSRSNFPIQHEVPIEQKHDNAFRNNRVHYENDNSSNDNFPNDNNDIRNINANMENFSENYGGMHMPGYQFPAPQMSQPPHSVLPQNHPSMHLNAFQQSTVHQPPQQQLHDQTRFPEPNRYPFPPHPGVSGIQQGGFFPGQFPMTPGPQSMMSYPPSLENKPGPSVNVIPNHGQMMPSAAASLTDGLMVQENHPTNQQTQLESERKWIERWLNDIHKSKEKRPVPPDNKNYEGDRLKICDAKSNVQKMMYLLASLRQLTTQLEGYVSDEEDQPWKTMAEGSVQIMKELETHREVLTDEKRLSDLQRRMQVRRKKRLREKGKRQREYEEKMEEEKNRQELHAAIDKWQAKIYEQNLNKKQEKEMKAAADSTLAEVRKKISDATKTMELIKGLNKLRKLRRDRLERQGVHVMTGNDKDFDQKTSEQLEMMTRQKDIYLAEERALKVMLEVEQEESKEREREKFLKIQQQKQEKLRKKQDIYLFGASVEVDESDALAPYYQYYDQANHNFEALVKIRSDWDTFLAPKYAPGASRIPDGFVLPVEPSSSKWSTALKDN